MMYALTQNEKVLDEVDEVLLFLKVFPSGRTAFVNAKNAFVKSTDRANEDPKNLMDKKAKHPYIIAIKSQIDQNAKYYIDIEKHLIPVSFFNR